MPPLSQSPPLRGCRRESDHGFIAGPRPAGRVDSPPLRPTRPDDDPGRVRPRSPQPDGLGHGRFADARQPLNRMPDRSERRRIRPRDRRHRLGGGRCDRDNCNRALLPAPRLAKEPFDDFGIPCRTVRQDLRRDRRSRVPALMCTSAPARRIGFGGRSHLQPVGLAGGVRPASGADQVSALPGRGDLRPARFPASRSQAGAPGGSGLSMPGPGRAAPCCYGEHGRLDREIREPPASAVRRLRRPAGREGCCRGAYAGPVQTRGSPGRSVRVSTPRPDSLFRQKARHRAGPAGRRAAER